MGTQLRQWAIRLLAAVALPIMLTLGLGAAANAQPVLASHVTSSTQQPAAPRYWEVYGPFDDRDSYCESQDRYDYRGEYWVWYLYVARCKCSTGDSDSRHLKK